VDEMTKGEGHDASEEGEVHVVEGEWQILDINVVKTLSLC